MGNFYLYLLELFCGLLTTVFLLNCSSSVDKTQQADTLMRENKVVAKEILKQKSDPQSLAGKIFFFAPGLDKETCKASGSCDCCSYNILFTTANTFVLIDYCEGDFSYNKGSYTLNASSLSLSIDKLTVNKNYNWDKETDTTGKVTTEYIYKIENIKPTTTLLKCQDCNGNTIFKGDGVFGAVDDQRSFEKEIQALKDEGIWTKLKLE